MEQPLLQNPHFVQEKSRGVFLLKQILSLKSQEYEKHVINEAIIPTEVTSFTNTNFSGN